MPVTVGPALPEHSDPLLLKGLTVSSVQQDYFSCQCPHFVDTSVDATSCLVRRKKRMRMTAEYVYARNRNIILTSVLDEIMSWSGYSSERKTFREAFSRSSDTPFRPLASGGKDVWNMCWSDPTLWVHAPKSHWGPTVNKILIDQAKGIAVIPVDKTKSCFWSLGEVAIDWWDLPHSVPILWDEEGWQYPQQKGLTTRVVLFDAFSKESGSDRPVEAWDDVLPGEDPQAAVVGCVGKDSGWAAPRAAAQRRGHVALPMDTLGTPSHLGHVDRVAATMPSQAHAGAAQEAPDIGQWEGQDVPLVRPPSCFVKGGIPSSRRYLPTYLKIQG